ncbi:MAG: hypothetical protein ACTSYD_09915 [Candidatus Heimdallarchaeaceae archaeon]
MQEEFKAVLERQTVLSKFLDRVNYRPLRHIYTSLNDLLPIIDKFLGSSEDSLSSYRTKLLNSFSLLARAFYQSSIVAQFRSSSAAEEFKEEVNRAYMKGIIEREKLIKQIESIITKLNSFIQLKEQLNTQWQETYYLCSSESNSETNIRKNFTAVLENFDKYADKYPSILEEGNFDIQRKIIEQVTDLSVQAVESCEKAQMTLHELLEMSINPLNSIVEDEIETADKILSQIHASTNDETNTMSDEEIGKLCDLLSWGLDDVNSFDELSKIGKELRNEFTNLIADFLVYLVDIDLGIQELESHILESVQKK